jgi:hypothetical protein
MNNPFTILDQRLAVIEELLIDIKHGGINILPQEDERETRDEVCARLKISLPTLHAEMKRGLPFEKIGRKTLFRRGTTNEYFQQKNKGYK